MASTSIPTSIYMKTNDRDSPNPGKLQFERAVARVGERCGTHGWALGENRGNNIDFVAIQRISAVCFHRDRRGYLYCVAIQISRPHQGHSGPQ